MVHCAQVHSVAKPMGYGCLERFLHVHAGGAAGARGLLDGSRRLLQVSANFLVSFTRWVPFHYRFVHMFSCYRYFQEVDVCRYQPNWHCERVKTVLHPYAPARLRLIAFQTYLPTQVDVCVYQPSYRYRKLHM